MQRRAENALVFMVKWPEPGRAKTRLSPPLSPAAAANLARAFLLDTLAEAARADADRWLAFAPAAAASSFRSLVGRGIGLIEAETADLGGALDRAQRAALATGYRRVALIAADLPHLDAGRYADAFAALSRADVAVGPSSDGGYYLLAAEQPTPSLFEGVTWGTASVYQETLQRAGESSLSIAEIATCDDVDIAPDLVWLFDALCRRPGAGHTLALLAQCPVLQEGVAAD
ncbi:MAG: TIGR04282 family arsenosugar biosynthesis glycosyltransferase [Dehalococcoidia bacterium]